MQNRTLLAAMGTAALLTACTQNNQFLTITPGNEMRASVVLLSEPEQENYFTDYFPTLDAIDSLQAGPGLTLGNVTDSTFVLSTSVPLSSLRLYSEGQVLSLVVEDGRNFKSGYAHLYTTGYDVATRTATLGFTQKPATVLALWQNIQLPTENIQMSENDIKIQLPEIDPNAPERTYLRVYAATANQPMSDILLPLQEGQVVTDVSQLNRHDPETQILYSLLIDRFCNGKSENDWSYIQECEKEGRPCDVLPQADYQGGDIVGVTQKIEEGFFDNLGINTIWISPITQNPYDVWGQYHNPDTRFTGYHGYWPIYITKVEERFATEEELRQMLQTAHEHGINVILDYVANHLHINSPLFQAHPEWATDSITPDGRRNFELWDDFRLTTWFDVHIPSLDLEQRRVADQLTDSALYWVRNYDFDGYRHDACKHIPLNYWRTFTRKMKNDPQLRNRSLWMIGETYGDASLIGSYVKSGMLNAQFNFNVYHMAIDVFSNHGGHTMGELATVIDESGAAYGSHHTMGNISGNHDKARFVSLAGGDLSWDEDDKAAGWNRHVGVGDSVRGYAKQLMLNKLNLTLPGVPCIYQGDEYGQEGANDPDNRRFMRFSGYNRFEQHNLDEVRKLAQMRRQSLALQFGDYIPLLVEDDVLIFVRSYLGETVLVGINNSESTLTLPVTIPAGLTGAGTQSVIIAPNDVTVRTF